MTTAHKQQDVNLFTANIKAFPALSGKQWFNSPQEELEAGIGYDALCHNYQDVIEHGVVPSASPHLQAIDEIEKKHPGWTLVYID